MTAREKHSRYLGHDKHHDIAVTRQHIETTDFEQVPSLYACMLGTSVVLADVPGMSIRNGGISEPSPNLVLARLA